MFISNRKEEIKMMISKAEYFLDRCYPILRFTFDTGLVASECSAESALNTSLTYLSRMGYTTIPKLISGHTISTKNIINVLTTNDYRYGSTESLLEDWFTENKVTKCLISVDALWYDPVAQRWFLRVICYDTKWGYVK